MKVKLYLFAAAVMLAAVFSGCKDDPIPPTVVTKPASGIAEGTATLNAEITNQGSDAVTSCGFYYNTSADMSYPEVVDANLDDSRFSSVISSLEPGKTYYYMAYAKSSAGMAEGEVLSFVTQAVKPTVETRPVSEVTTSGATLNAAIPSDGGGGDNCLWLLLQHLREYEQQGNRRVHGHSRQPFLGCHIGIAEFYNLLLQGIRHQCTRKC